MSTETTTMLINLVLIPLLVALGGFAISWLKLKSTQIQKQLENEDMDILAKYFDTADDAIISAVSAIHQVLVDNLKQDGSFDSQAQQLAFEQAKEEAISIMGPTLVAILQDSVGDFDKWIKSKIEATVRETKL